MLEVAQVLSCYGCYFNINKKLYMGVWTTAVIKGHIP